MVQINIVDHSDIADSVAPACDVMTVGKDREFKGVRMV